MQTNNKTGSKIKRMVICASLSALMLGLSGCGGSQNVNKDISEGTTPVQEESSASTEGTTPVQEESSVSTEGTTPVQEESSASTEGTTPVQEESNVSSDDTQNPIMNFIGEYASDRILMTVSASGSTGASIKITWAGSVSELEEWTMSGEAVVEDDNKITVHYTDCQKKGMVYNEDGSVASETVEYENGTGTITFIYENSVVTWEDEQEHIADDREFTWAR